MKQKACTNACDAVSCESGAGPITLRALLFEARLRIVSRVKAGCSARGRTVTRDLETSQTFAIYQREGLLHLLLLDTRCTYVSVYI